MKIAIVGAGISGIAAADAMSSIAAVTLFEADPRLGGHTDSHTVLLSEQVYSVDTGFVAFNEAQYPSFSAWLQRLGVTSQQAHMSLSVSCPPRNFEYATSDLASLFPSLSAVFSYPPNINCWQTFAASTVRSTRRWLRTRKRRLAPIYRVTILVSGLLTATLHPCAWHCGQKLRLMCCKYRWVTLRLS